MLKPIQIILKKSIQNPETLEYQKAEIEFNQYLDLEDPKEKSEQILDLIKKSINKVNVEGLVEADAYEYPDRKSVV